MIFPAFSQTVHLQPSGWLKEIHRLALCFPVTVGSTAVVPFVCPQRLKHQWVGRPEMQPSFIIFLIGHLFSIPILNHCDIQFLKLKEFQSLGLNLAVKI